MSQSPSGRATDTQVGVTDSKTIKLAQFDQQRPETDILDIFGQSVSSEGLWACLRVGLCTPPLKTPASIMWMSGHCLQFLQPNRISHCCPKLGNFMSRSEGCWSFCLASWHPSLEMAPSLFVKRKRDFCSFPTKAISSASYINMGFILISV